MNPEWGMMMIRGLKQICYEDRLRKLELSKQQREGSGEALHLLSVPKGATGELEREF